MSTAIDPPNSAHNENFDPAIRIVDYDSSWPEEFKREADLIRRYHREGPELMALLQLHSRTHLIHYYYGSTWALTRKVLFNWSDEQAGDFETLVKTFFAPSRVLRILTDFILFTRMDNELSKVWDV